MKIAIDRGGKRTDIKAAIVRPNGDKAFWANIEKQFLKLSV